MNEPEKYMREESVVEIQYLLVRVTKGKVTHVEAKTTRHSVVCPVEQLAAIRRRIEERQKSLRAQKGRLK